MSRFPPPRGVMRRALVSLRRLSGRITPLPNSNTTGGMWPAARRRPKACRPRAAFSRAAGALRRPSPHSRAPASSLDCCLLFVSVRAPRHSHLVESPTLPSCHETRKRKSRAFRASPGELRNEREKSRLCRGLGPCRGLCLGPRPRQSRPPHSSGMRSAAFCPASRAGRRRWNVAPCVAAVRSRPPTLDRFDLTAASPGALCELRRRPMLPPLASADCRHRPPGVIAARGVDHEIGTCHGSASIEIEAYEPTVSVFSRAVKRSRAKRGETPPTGVVCAKRPASTFS